jgi:drug/metabolite transporter (DMT)-like permease
MDNHQQHIKLPILIIAFNILSGAYSSIGGQYIHEYGAGDSRALLSNICGMFGYLLAGIIPKLMKRSSQNNNKSQSSSSSSLQLIKYIIVIVSIELCANYLCNVGFSIVGSGLYTVCYSASVVFSTILSIVFLGKQPSRLQLIGVSVVTVGLSLSATASDSTMGDNMNSTKLLYGILITLCGVACWSISAAIQDYLLNTRKDLNIAASDLCLYCGGIETIIICIYTVLYTLPRWNELIVEPVKVAGGHSNMVALLGLSIVINSIIVNTTYLHLISTLGSVSACLMSAVTTTMVFASSAVLFCNPRTPQQCFNNTKGVSVLCVIAGVVLYGIGSKSTKAVEKKEKQS